MKQYFILIFIVFSLQTVAQQAIVPCGFDFSGTGGSVSFTIGQTDFKMLSSSTGNISEGVQQTYIENCRFSRGTLQSKTICASLGSINLDSIFSITEPVSGILVTWSIFLNPISGTLAGSMTATSTGGILLPSGLGYTPLFGFSGIDSFIERVVAGRDTVYTTVHIRIDTPLSVIPITGADSVCTGSTIVLTSITTGGVWNMSNTHASVSSGAVSGISMGLDTAFYTLTNACGVYNTSKTIGILPLPIAGTITGAGSLCIGASITLNDIATGGVWSCTNGKAVNSLNIVTGAIHGSDTVKYTVANSCGTVHASKVIFIDTIANAGAISGSGSVCAGSVIYLSESVTGGIWSRSNTHASVSGSGTVTGLTAGIDTIKYTVTNSCGASEISRVITVNPHPVSGTIIGTSYTMCVGSIITLVDTTTGGIWSCTNTHAFVSGGLVEGMTAGIDSVLYIVSNMCGTASSRVTVTVNPMPNAGTITGYSTVCMGVSVTLADVASGGTWSVSNSSASVTGGIVSGISAGSDTVSYTVINTCGVDIASKVITVEPVTDAGTIGGNISLCVGAHDTLTETVTGGVWSVVNTHASVSSGGVVTGVIAGTDSIKYTITGLCGLATASTVITIIPLADAGVISGSASVCTGSVIALSETMTGGNWSVSNFHASITTGGTVTGASVGVDTVFYVVSNICGTNTASKTITVNTLPNASTITGSDSICTGNTITLLDMTTGGTWWCTNSHASATAGGIISGVSAGWDTVMYRVSNACGADTARLTIHINTAPLSFIEGVSYACIGTPDTLTGIPAGGAWSVTNGNATIASTGIVTGISAGTDTVVYVVTTICGIKADSMVVAVHTVHECDSLLRNPNTSKGDDAIQIYPNPTTGIFNIECNGVTDKLSYTVTDVYGKVILTNVITPKDKNELISQPVDISALARGTYLIKVITPDKVVVEKIVLW